MDFPRRSINFSLLLGGCCLFFSACLQLETPHTFREDEEVKIRAKNLQRYYQDLEEEIQLEQYHIKLLQDTIEINRTREQALAEQVQKKNKDINTKKKDINNLDNEIAGLEAQLKERRDRRQSLQAELDKEHKKTEEIEKSIALEAGRIGQARAKLSHTLGELQKLENEVPTREDKISQRKKFLKELSKAGADLDVQIRAELLKLGIIKQEELAALEEEPRLKAERIGEAREQLKKAAEGLASLEKSIEALQKYYDAKKEMGGDLQSIEESTKTLLESIEQIQQYLEEK